MPSMAAAVSSASILLNLFALSNFYTPRVSIRLLQHQQLLQLQLKKRIPIFYRRMTSVSAGGGLGVEEKITAPYGSWKSPITADVVSGAEKRLGGSAVDGAGCLLWVESRPSDAGRAVLVKESEKPGGKPLDITPEGFAVRTLAQEYGGGAFTVFGSTVVFSNYKDQRLYKQTIGESAKVS
ncbi:hypothetical protein ACLOJK_013598 [Asimina triloba]